MKWMFLFAAVAAVAIYYRPLAEVDYAALAPRTWAGIGYVVVCSTFLSYFMVPVGQRYLRPTVVSMYNYVQPLVAVLFTVAVGLDTFGFTKGVAALCVFAGVWLVTKSKSRAQLDAERAAAEQARKIGPGHKKPTAENTKLLIVPVLQETDLTDMKSLLLLAATICCACCSCVQPKHYPDYSVSSGFALDSSTPGIRRSSKTSVSPAVYGVTSSTTIPFSPIRPSMSITSFSDSCRKSPKPPRPNATKSFPNG